jgi:asparagine synthase (glutamine-hydrolysing)
MCGIAGYLGQLPLRWIEPMSAALQHRGPDGAGVWRSESHGVALAHRRLAIIDRSSSASQPMASCGGRYRVVFNGEIYNYRALAFELAAKGYRFNERSDTSVLGPLYDLHGPEMLSRLNGIFAFAIWDCETGKLFAARDAFGVKPFYYACFDTGFAFASEIKALLPIEGFDRSIDEAALRDYLLHLWSPGERTMFKGVKKLLPGHFLRVELGGRPQIVAWREQAVVDQSPSLRRRSVIEEKAALLSLFDRVVSDQCVSDVPIGAFLSGGVDSCAIVASMIAGGNKPTRTYCVGFDGPGLEAEGFGDDLAYARRFAVTLDVPLQPIMVRPMTGDDLERLVGVLDEPQADPAPLYVEAISEAARDDGVKVLMSGAGGDDIFSGYRRHVAAALRGRLGSFAPYAGRLLAGGAMLSNGTLRRKLRKLSYMFEGSDDDFLCRAFEFTPSADVERCLSEDARLGCQIAGRNELEKTLEASNGAPLLRRMLLMERAGFLPDHNLNYTDKASMTAGVEVRVPFLDERLVDFADRTSPELEVRRGRAKWLLREAMRGRVPDAILDRKKTGFGAPVRLWVAGPMRPMIEDIVASASFRQSGAFDVGEVRRLLDDTFCRRRDGAYLILAIVMVELWLRRFRGGMLDRKSSALAAL